MLDMITHTHTFGTGEQGQEDPRKSEFLAYPWQRIRAYFTKKHHIYMMVPSFLGTNLSSD